MCSNFLSKFSLFVLCLFSPFCFADEDFYVFDVGQGSCNLIVYKKSGTGILFDAGSKNSKTLSKILFFQDEEEPVAIFATSKPYPKKENIKTDKSPKFLLEQMESMLKEEKTPIKNSRKSMSFEESAKKKSRINDIAKKIKDKIKSYNLNLLFIFLSHPDEDHINLIPKIVPENINSLEAFLGGDWVNHQTTDTKEVLEYLKTKTANINFPYYWKYQGSLTPEYNEQVFTYSGKHNKYLELRKVILNDMKNAKKLLSLINFPMYTDSKLINTSFFSSPTLWDIGKVLYVKNPSDDQEYRDKVPQDWRNIFFRSFGAETSVATPNNKEVVNAQSLIVSFALPSLKTIVTCTGDADSETISSIKEINITYPNIDNYLQATVIPHHGAIKNFSGNIITKLKPDLFFVSAGLTSYDHPNMYALEAYEKSIASTERFRQQYTRTENVPLYMSIGRNNKTNLGYKMIPFNGNAVLSTNLLGDISWRNSEIYSSYSNIIDYENKKYLVDVSSSIHKLYDKLINAPQSDDEEQLTLEVCKKIIANYNNQLQNIRSLKIDDFPIVLNANNGISYAVFLKSPEEYRLYRVLPL